MTETVVQVSPKMVADFRADQVKWRKEAEVKAKQALMGEGIEFYLPSLALQYQTLREDMKMQAGECGNGRLMVNLAEQMAMVRAQDESEYWQDRWDREVMGETV